jgi:acetyltransferase
VIVSGGFSESGPEGAELQLKIERLCNDSGFRLLGPNTAGFVNKQLSLTASFVPSAGRIPAGSIAVIAQSAGINLTVSFLLAKLGYGVSCGVGLGNAIDIDAADVLEFVAEQPATKAIALHLEGVRLGRRLYDTLRRVTPQKPVAVLTIGKAEIGEFARSHTGALIGSHDLRSSALRQAGAVLVESTEELAVAAAALSLHRLPPKSSPGIGVLTAQAGAGLVMLDLLKSSGVSVPPLTGPTLTRISAQLPPMTYLKNPVDTGRPGPSFAGVLSALADDIEIDAVIVYALSEPAALRPTEVVASVAKQLAKPILFGTMGPREEIGPTIDALRMAGLYVAESPEELARAARALARDATLQARLARANSGDSLCASIALPREADEYAAKQVLQNLGIPVPAGIACASHEEAHQAFERLAKPVVAKILASEIAHKTEAGGVQLNIGDHTALAAALARLDAIPLDSARRYLIEEMAPAGLELIVSATRDPSFGPTVMVGLGGTLAEAFKDTATRLAPLTALDAQEMLNELRSAALLDGWRGAPRSDRDAVAQAIVSLGSFLCRHSSIEQLEINPLRVYATRVLALDALILLGSEPPP